MSDTRHDVKVDFIAKDNTTAVISRISKAAGKLANRVDSIANKVTGFAAGFGGIGAAFGFAASVHSANQYLSTIDRISTITGRTANSTAGLVDAMDQVGITSEETSAVMISIARKQAEIKGGSKELIKLSKRYGVELKKGPEAALISMSKSLKEGKIGTGEVVKLLEESGSKAMALLEKGPAEVQRLLAEGAQKNSHINDKTINQYKKMDSQMKRVRQSWTRISTRILVKLLPKLTKGMQYVENHIDGWAASADRFGQFMNDHMEQAIKSAKLFGKIMLTNKLLMVATGEGLATNSKKLLSIAMGGKKGDKKGLLSRLLSRKAAVDTATSVGPISGRKGVQAKRAARFKEIFPDKKSPLKAFAARMKSIGKMAAPVGKVFTRIFVGVMKIGKIVRIFARFTAIGLIIGGIANAFGKIVKNVDGIRTRIGNILSKIWKDISSIGETISGAFGEGSALGRLMDWVGDKVLWIFEAGLNLIRKITRFAAVAAVVLTERVMPAEAEQILLRREQKKSIGQWEKAYAIQKKLSGENIQMNEKNLAMVRTMSEHYSKWGQQWARGKSAEQIEAEYLKRLGWDKPTKGREKPINNYDFRNSSFQIEQNFPDGFDPDRVAVAFADDLAALGERRLQSGLAPIFSAR